MQDVVMCEACETKAAYWYLMRDGEHCIGWYCQDCIDDIHDDVLRESRGQANLHWDKVDETAED